MNCWRILVFACACFSLSAEVVINEIHYDPSVKTELAEFIELHNTGPAVVSLRGWRLNGTVDFAFPETASLAAGGYAVIAENPSALKARFGLAAYGPWSGLLSNEGGTIELRNEADVPVDKVTYRLGFPWPTVGDAPGYSIELVNPGFDNDLGGNWRRSVSGNVSSPTQVLIPPKSQWKYRKGASEPSNPVDAWRALGFDDSSWSTGPAPIGYDPGIAMGTALADMRNNYTSIYFRRKFQVTAPEQIGSLTLEAMYDDGIQVWINGRRVVNSNLPDRDVAFSEVSTGAARESDSYDPFVLNSPGAFLRAGENVIAVQLHNVSLTGSSDAYLDLKLTAQLGSANAGPTPGARNSAFQTNLPPVIRQVEHFPEQPKSGEPVTITAKITDSDGVAWVQLLYQIVEPGRYIELNDFNYETEWNSLAMHDDGSGGDAIAHDSIFTAVLPGDFQLNRRLMRYRVQAADTGNQSVRVPYADDPEPNFAYFVYDGVPAWNASIQPGGAAQNFSANEMGRLPVYHLLSKRASVEDSTWNSRYGGDLYRWWGTLVYDGKVYDHIRYRARGGVWRYAMGKNMWKFDLNRGHEFQARDNYGRKYSTKWKKINLGACIQQGDYLHRGEQGMFESVGFALFNLAGVEAPKTHWISFRVIDDVAEAPNQYNGDYWGLYLAVEQEDGRFLDEHDLPDGNLYKMEGGTGELNNQGRYAATDKSDLNTFIDAYRNQNPSTTWWRQNFDLERYFSYHTIVHGIHHYDICDGKNYFYFRNPETGLWSVHTWDLDLTWANNMYRDCDGADPFRALAAAGGLFNLEFRNRAREIRDLLFNTDQAWKLIDEYAIIVKGTNAGPNILAADRAMWDYNPVMTNSSIVNLSKAGQGRYYEFPYESSRNPARKGSFAAGLAIMKDYIVERSSFIDQRITDNLLPGRPAISYIGPAGFPLNRLEFQSSAFSGSAAFAAMKWRLGEVRDAAPGVPGIYEIESVWETPALAAFSDKIAVPAETLRVGHKYRARARVQDVSGRWSNWSFPVEFTAGEPDNASALQQYLRPSEIMYNPVNGAHFEFLELHNTSTNLALQLAGAAFTDGIDYIFPTGAQINPGGYALLVNTAAVGDFKTFYGLDSSVVIFGPYGGNLDNSGERITLKTALAGSVVFSFVYDDSGDWPSAADGQGYSLVLQNEAELDSPASWRASSAVNGSPGRADATPLELTISLNATVLTLQFTADATRIYRLEGADVIGAAWQPVREFDGASGPVSFQQTVLSIKQRYFRLVATPR